YRLFTALNNVSSTGDCFLKSENRDGTRFFKKSEVRKMKKNSKARLGIKFQLLMQAILPLLIVGLSILIIMCVNMKNALEKKVKEGLLAAATLYGDYGVMQDAPEGDCTIEDRMKQETGFDYTWFSGGKRFATSVIKKDGTRPLGTPAADEVIEAVMNKKQIFTSKNTDVAGEKYYVAYIPIINEDGSVDMAFAGEPKSKVEAEINSAIIMVVVIALALTVIALVIVYFIANKLADVVSVTLNSIEHLSNGEFVKIDKYQDRNDELGDMIRDTNSLIDTLHEIVSDIKKEAKAVGEDSSSLSDAALQISTTTEGVSTAVGEMANGATQQAQDIQSATENVGNMGESIASVSSSANMLSSTVESMNETSKKSAESLETLVAASDEMAESVASISEKIEATRKAVDEINGKVDAINNIAAQTNLLSLNASIEAARAGEAGRGFAVVADEIRQLADDSANSAKEIRETMEKLITDSGAAVEEAAKVQESVKNQKEIMESTTAAIDDLLSGINTTVSEVEGITSYAAACDSSKAGVIDAMSGLSAVSEQNAASSQETSASVEELNSTVQTLAESAEDLKSIADKLNDNVSFFKD
nr:methyl-accepting chemotaxis protein [Lachnospiraceae bacterium]